MPSLSWSSLAVQFRNQLSILLNLLSLMDHVEQATMDSRWPPGSPPATQPSTDHPTGSKEQFQRLTSHALMAATAEPRPRYGPSPLDAIPSSIYMRFPRFSTTETSSPDLSTEERNSTRLSVDEHAIVQTAPSLVPVQNNKRGKVHVALREAISTPSLGLRAIKDKLRRTPSTLSGTTLQQEPNSSSDQKSSVRD